MSFATPSSDTGGGDNIVAVVADVSAGGDTAGVPVSQAASSTQASFPAW
jgi:hypothetical protein